MFPYYLLVFLPLLFSAVRFKTKSKILYNRLPLITFFAFFIILLSLRSVNCGADLVNYQNKFDNISFGSLESIFGASQVEPGYSLFSAISKWLVDDFQFFIFLCAVVSVVPIMLLYIHETEHDRTYRSTDEILPIFTEFRMAFDGNGTVSVIRDVIHGFDH